MENNVSTVQEHKARNVWFGIALIVGGLIIAALTWLTIWGAFFGLGIAFLGVMLLMRVHYKPGHRDPTDAEGYHPTT